MAVNVFFSISQLAGYSDWPKLVTSTADMAFFVVFKLFHKLLTNTVCYFRQVLLWFNFDLLLTVPEN